MGVLATVTPGPPADSVDFPTAKAVGFAVKVTLPTVKRDVGRARAGVAPLIVASDVYSKPSDVKTTGLAAVVLVLPSMTRLPDDPRLTATPEKVTRGPPAVTGVPAMSNEVGLAVTVLPAIVKTERPVEEPRLPTTKLPDGPKLTGVPSMLTPAPPGVITAPIIETADGSEMVNVWPAAVTTGWRVELASFKVLVLD